MAEWLKGFGRKGKWYRRGWVALAAVWLPSVSATTYTYSLDEYSNGVDVCIAVQQALQRGLVLDAEEPLGLRRFRLSPKAVRYGFSLVHLTPVPKSQYGALVSQMVPIIGNQKAPLTKAELSENKAAVDRIINKYGATVYRAHFDNGNSGVAHDVYLLDMGLEGSSPDQPTDRNPTIFMANPDGTLNSYWGVNDETSGSPFIYKGKTYYARWEYLGPFMMKGGSGELHVYRSLSVPVPNAFVDYEVFPPPYCKIYQSEQGVR